MIRPLSSVVIGRVVIMTIPQADEAANFRGAISGVIIPAMSL